MKKMSFMLMAAALTLLVFPGYSLGQGGNAGQGWGPGSKYNRLYNPATAETDTGEVLSVERVRPMKGMSYGVHVVLNSDKGVIIVHVGPSWYLEKEGITLAEKDKIVVSGSRVIFQGKPTLIAAELKKGEKTWKLRDESGVPLWSGRKGRY